MLSASHMYRIYQCLGIVCGFLAVHVPCRKAVSSHHILQVVLHKDCKLYLCVWENQALSYNDNTACVPGFWETGACISGTSHIRIQRLSMVMNLVVCSAKNIITFVTQHVLFSAKLQTLEQHTRHFLLYDIHVLHKRYRQAAFTYVTNSFMYHVRYYFSNHKSVRHIQCFGLQIFQLIVIYVFTKKADILDTTVHFQPPVLSCCMVCTWLQLQPRH